MARAVVLTIQLAAASANNICLSQTPTSGTALTLNGSAVSGGVATLDTQRRVLLTFGNEASNRTLVITGTRGDGAAIGETLNIASGASGTIATEQDFLTITSAMPGGGGWTAAITLGTNTVGSTGWQVPNQHITPFEIGIAIEGTSGTGAQIEVTQDSPLLPIAIYAQGYSQTPPIPTPFVWAGLTGNPNAIGKINQAVAAWRLTIVDGTGLVTATGQQSGIRN